MADVLVVEDKDSLRLMLRETLVSRGWSVEDVADAYEARRRLASTRYLAVLTDLRLPAGNGLEVLQAALDADPDTPVIVMTAFGTVEEAVKAMKLGAADFLTKPVDTDHLLVVLDRALERRRLLTELVVLRDDYQRKLGLPRVLGEDPALKETLLAVQRAAPSDATVLLLGESGTGKELMSRMLHQLSPRSKGPFVTINCAAIPENLIENELFGHEKGAFTGAVGRKVGKAELAHRGTLFLDEIGDLPLSLQGKILRLVQEKQFERVGGIQTLTVDIRLVAATNRDLRAAVQAKEFREDLFFRLSVLPIDIPPLRRRRGDILPLAEAFLQRFSRDMGRRTLRFSDAARRVLLDHSWPGNVRELQNCIERAAILCNGNLVEPVHFRIGETTGSGPTLADVLDLSGPLREVGPRAAARAETEAIALALRDSAGDHATAAERLGLSVEDLAQRLEQTPTPAH